MRPQFTNPFRNRKFAVAIVALVGLLAIGLLAVAGVALLNKMQAVPAPTAVATPTFTAAPTSTRFPTATREPTPRPTATLVPVATATATGAPTAQAQPAEAPTGGEEVPDTGGSLLPLFAASAAFSVLLVAARKGRHRED